MSESREAKVQRLSEEAVHKAVASERRDFTITKFGRSEDGYFHARVTPAGGKAVYVHRKYGAWMAPGTERGQAVMKEVVKEVAVELQARARQIEKAERIERERIEQERIEQEEEDSSAAETAAGERQAPEPGDGAPAPEHLRES